MKNWIIVLSLLLIVSCEKQQLIPIQVADNFIKHFYISDSYDIKDVNKYMIPEYVKIYNSLSDKDKKIHEQYIGAMIDEVRNILTENNFEYRILRSEEFKEEYPPSKILFNGNGEIFMLKTKGRLLFSLIVQNDKLYSFCPDMYLSTKEQTIPYFFMSTTKFFNSKK